MSDQLIYMDNAATSFPKSRRVLEGMIQTYVELGASPGRGTYDLAIEAANYVADAREQIASFFGATDPNRVIFAANATDALNLGIQGLVSPGGHVVSTRLEHNSVLRPLFHLKERGWIDYDLVPFNEKGLVDADDVECAIRPNTQLVVICHGSQVLGTVQPVDRIAQVCSQHGVPLLVDAAQSAGQVPVNMGNWGVTAVAFTGHKALLGPSGSGGLVLAPDAEVKSTRFGGTGVESSSLRHPQSFPYRLEAGTLNILGVIGLCLGLKELQRTGMQESHQREMALIRRLRQGLCSLPHVTVHSPIPRDDDLPLLTCSVEGLVPEDVGAILDADYGIAVRTGLHCAPFVHSDLGVSDKGSVRFSLGRANTKDDVERALEAMADVVKSVRM